MYKRIVLAYDGNSYSSAALIQGTELAKLCKAELHLLGIVVTTGSWGLAQAESSIDVWGSEQQYLQQALDSATHDLVSQSINVIGSIRRGDPGIEIAAYAHQIKADLVVLGHSEKGIIMRWFDGSVGIELLENLPCSLLIATS